MSNLPKPVSLLVAEAVEWLDANRVNVSRRMAETLLPHWQHYANLTEAERRLVLCHFAGDGNPHARADLPGTRVPVYSSKPGATDSDDPQVRKESADLPDAPVREECRQLIERIDARLHGHAWTVRRLPDHGMDDFMWMCRCGHEILQAQGFPGVVDQLIAHCAEATASQPPAVEPGKAQRDIAAYRKRLDAWSREQQARLDELEPDA